MEIKKTTSASLENKSFEFLLLGLVVALGFLFIVFEWSTGVSKTNYVTKELDFTPEEMMPVTFTKPELPPPAAAEPVVRRVISPNIIITNNTTPTADVVIPTDEPEPFVAPVATPEVIDEDPIILIAEVQPSFPGGTKAMYAYLAKNIKYPASLIEAGVQGRVIVSFVVNKDGSIQNVEVVNEDANDKLKAEAIRVVESMPAWSPGQMQGINVRCKFILPVNFRLPS
ncbi:MAG: TonB family protein [Paludibacteraceae bacterium]|nr:TonB family protein [Paludibacteraceae bacterium]